MFLISLLTLVSVLPAPQGERAAPVTVFVTSVGAANGFTDPSKDNADTVKDLQESIRDQHLLALVERPEDAAIVLTVIGRETAQMTAAFLGVGRDRMIRVKFTSGEVETELTASAQGGVLTSGGSWGKAAKKIAKQVNEWVKKNPAVRGTPTAPNWDTSILFQGERRQTSVIAADGGEPKVHRRAGHPTFPGNPFSPRVMLWQHSVSGPADFAADWTEDRIG